MNQNVVNTASASNIVPITTLGGVSFTHFAKTSAWGQSIFGNLIGPYYKQSLIVETWMRPYEAPVTPPETQQGVYSVLTLTAPINAQWGGQSWKEGEDHSKWGVAQDRSFPLTCIGDINHQLSQYARSGGFACIRDATIHAAFMQLITSTDENNNKAAKDAEEQITIALE